MPQFKLALVQLFVTGNKSQNLRRAAELVSKAAAKGANIVVLPECFNSSYGTQYFAQFAEPLDGGETSEALSQMASSNNIYLVGGSFPEISASNRNVFYNTSTIWDKKGARIGVHRKLHLFDIDLPTMKFKESEVLSAGSEITMVETEYGKLGIGICYDMRFPELCTIAARKGAVAMLYPGAFNLTTGPLHWELLQRARAVDNQLFVAACSPARDMDASYHAWGHSTIVDPMGRVIATCEEGEDVVYADIDTALIDSTRAGIPVSKQRRFDLYPDVSA